MRRLGLAALLGVLSCPGGAHAALTVGDLLQQCDSADPSAQKVCEGYLRAFVDMAALQVELRMGDQAVSACLPAGVSYPEVTWELLVLMRANVQEHPDARASPASVATYAMLGGGFPCR